MYCIKCEKVINEFLQHSNFIENERSLLALEDAKRAWDLAMVSRDEITLDLILDIHYALMQELDEKIAGKLRNCDVFIGGQRKIFISETLLKEELTKWLEDLDNLDPVRTNDDLQNTDVKLFTAMSEKFAKDMHIRFEEIHPFADGNGRTGRILYNIHRLNLGLNIHVIHEGEEQQEYYSWFSTSQLNTD